MQSGWQPPPHGPVPSWARPPIDGRRLRPRSWWYAVSAIPPLIGIGLAALFVVLAVRAFPDEPRPFTAPHTLAMRLDGGDEQTIWSQTRGAPDPSVDAPPACVVRNRDSERRVAVSRSGNTTLTVGDNRYQAQLDFSPPADGVYSVACRPALRAEVQALAIGDQPHLARFVAFVVAAIASFVLGLLLCGGAVALVAILRHRHKRRLQDEEMARRYPA